MMLMSSSGPGHWSHALRWYETSCHYMLPHLPLVPVSKLLVSSECFTGAQRGKHLIARGIVTYNYVSCRSVCDRDQN